MAEEFAMVGVPSREVHFAAIVVALSSSLILSALVNLQLFQDGASYLFEQMISGSAIRHDRLGVYIVQAPSILSLKAMSLLGTNPFERLEIQRVLFCLNYAAVPLFAIVASWLVAREDGDELLFWSLMLILFVNLVNFSWVSEQLIAIQLACPLMLACFLHSRRWWVRLLAVAHGVVIFLLHPLSSLLFFVIAIGCLVAGRRREGLLRATFVTSGILFLASILGGIRALWHMSDYERSMVQPVNAYEYLLVTPIENIVFLSCALVIGFNRLPLRNSGTRHGSTQRVIDVALAVVGCVALIFRYLVGTSLFPLKTGLALIVSMALILFASIDRRGVVSEAERRYRSRFGLVLSLCFAAVTVAKSAIWYRTTEALERTLMTSSTACIERSDADLRWMDERPGTIIDTWALPSLVLVKQVGDPPRFLLASGDCAALQERGEVRIDPWTTLSLDQLRAFTAREGARR